MGEPEIKGTLTVIQQCVDNLSILEQQQKLNPSMQKFLKSARIILKSDYLDESDKINAMICIAEEVHEELRAASFLKGSQDKSATQRDPDIYRVIDKQGSDLYASAARDVSVSECMQNICKLLMAFKKDHDLGNAVQIKKVNDDLNKICEQVAKEKRLTTRADISEIKTLPRPPG